LIFAIGDRPFWNSAFRDGVGQIECSGYSTAKAAVKAEPAASPR